MAHLVRQFLLRLMVGWSASLSSLIRMLFSFTFMKHWLLALDWKCCILTKMQDCLCVLMIRLPRISSLRNETFNSTVSYFWGYTFTVQPIHVLKAIQHSSYYIALANVMDNMELAWPERVEVTCMTCALVVWIACLPVRRCSFTHSLHCHQHRTYQFVSGKVCIEWSIRIVLRQWRDGTAEWLLFAMKIESNTI